MNLRNNPLFGGINILTSTLSTALRPGMGINAEPAAVKPEKLLRLYEFEGCPFCRLVREALTELDLDALIHPCPKNGARYRPQVKKMGGKTQFPYLVDPNTGTAMYESMDIVAYLFETYGQRPLPLKWRAGALQKTASTLSGVPRPWQGQQARSATPLEKPLELYSFESSPFARPVRELLCELEIAYVLRSCGRTSLRDWVPPPVRKALDIKPSAELDNRRFLLDRAGKISIPYLIDPNTQTEMFESANILEYLRKTYA